MWSKIILVVIIFIIFLKNIVWPFIINKLIPFIINVIWPCILFLFKLLAGSLACVAVSGVIAFFMAKLPFMISWGLCALIGTFLAVTVMTYKGWLITIASLLYIGGLIKTLYGWLESEKISEVRESEAYKDECIQAIALMIFPIISMIIITFLKGTSNYTVAVTMYCIGSIVEYTSFTSLREISKGLHTYIEHKNVFLEKNIYTYINTSKSNKVVLSMFENIIERTDGFWRIGDGDQRYYIRETFINNQIKKLNKYLNEGQFIDFDSLKQLLPLPLTIEELVAFVLEEGDGAVLAHTVNEQDKTYKQGICKSIIHEKGQVCVCCGRHTSQPITTKWGEVCCEECENAMSKFDDELNSSNELEREKISLSAVAVSSLGFKKMYEQESRYINKSKTSHGIAAEYFNNDIDKLLGHEVEHVGANNAKNGPDRIVDGVQIQTKYYKTGKLCIDAVFEEGHYRYRTPDGDLMIIEVPRDNYADAVRCMEKHILNGDVEGCTDPDMAKYLVKKGYIKYQDAVNLTKISTTSVLYDAGKGIESAFPGIGMSAVSSFVMSIFVEGKDVETATRKASDVALKVTEMAAVRGIGQGSTQRLLNQLTKTSKIDINPSMEQVISSTGGCAAMLVISNWRSVVNWSEGKLSGQGLAADIAGDAAGIVAGAVGGGIANIILGPVAGFIAGAILTSIASSTVNEAVTDFKKDDIERMQRLYRDELAWISQNYLLSEEEVNEIHDGIAGESYKEFLRQMFYSKDPCQYAATIIVPAVGVCYAKRPLITL